MYVEYVMANEKLPVDLNVVMLSLLELKNFPASEEAAWQARGAAKYGGTNILINRGGTIISEEVLGFPHSLILESADVRFSYSAFANSRNCLYSFLNVNPFRAE